MSSKRWVPLIVVILLAVFSGCSTKPVKTQAYAKLSNTKSFEEEYPIVWKAILSALSEYKILEKNEEAGFARTDWVYSTSTEKYVEYEVNNLPKKKYLQTRYKFLISAEKQIGAVKVTVNSEEDIEILRSDGTSDGWKSASEPDSSRQNELLRNIELKILSNPHA